MKPIVVECLGIRFEYRVVLAPKAEAAEPSTNLLHGLRRYWAVSN
jgi:hypothetical protein